MLGTCELSPTYTTINFQTLNTNNNDKYTEIEKIKYKVYNTIIY